MEHAVTYLKILTKHSLGKEKNHKILQSGYLVSGPETNPGPLEYKAGRLSTEFQHLVDLNMYVHE
jgi:hypothetical protein